MLLYVHPPPPAQAQAQAQETQAQAQAQLGGVNPPWWRVPLPLPPEIGLDTTDLAGANTDSSTSLYLCSLPSVIPLEMPVYERYIIMGHQ